MTVSIDIDLDAIEAFHEIGNLKVALESLDEDLDLDLDLDGDLGDKIDKIGDALDEIGDDFAESLDEPISRLEDLDLGEATVVEGGGDSGGDTGSDSGDSDVDLFRRLNRDQESDPEDIGQALRQFQSKIDGINGSGDWFPDNEEGDTETKDFGERLKTTIRSAMGDYNDRPDPLENISRNNIFGEIRDSDGIREIDLRSDRDPEDYPDMSPSRLRDELASGIREDIQRTNNVEVADVQAELDELFGEDFDFEIDPDLSDEETMIGDTPVGRTSLRQELARIGYGGDQMGGGVVGPGDGIPDAGRGGGFPDKKDTSIFGKTRRQFGKVSDAVDTISDTFRRNIPSMRVWYNLFAAVVPVLGAFAVQALGVAAAMGAVAIAGASLIGLGLIGHGDTMAESFKNAKEQIADLGSELFDVFQPTAEAFAPIQESFFDFVPGQMATVAESMEGLTVYEDTLFAMFSGLTDFIGQFFDLIVKHSEVISQLAMTFGAILGTNLLGFFTYLLRSGYENQKMLIELGETFKILSKALYEVFHVIAQAVVMLQPFFKVLGIVASLLNNDLIAGMLAAVAVMYIVNSVLGLLWASFMSLGMAMLTSMGPAFSALITWMASYIGGALTMIGVNASLAASIGLVTAAMASLMAVSGVGLLVSALGIGKGMLGGGNTNNFDNPTGGMAGSGASRGGTTNVYEGDEVNVNIEGNANGKQVEKFRDMRSRSKREDAIRNPEMG